MLGVSLLYLILIKNKKTGEVVREIPCNNTDIRSANKALIGLNINLNHKKYVAEVECVDG